MGDSLSLQVLNQTGNSIMKVLIRDTESGMYCAGMNRWTEQVAEARDFQQPFVAIQFASENGFTSADLVYYFGAERKCLVRAIPTGFPPRRTEFAA